MIRDVHHVGIAVRSMEEALAFYCDALGLPLVKEGVASARGVRAAMLGVGRSYLEILEPFTEESPFAQHIAQRGEGLHHIALWTDDVESQVAALRDADVPLEDREPREGFTGRLSYLAAEAFDGALVEVVQPDGSLPGMARPAEAEATVLRSGLGAQAITRIDHVVLRVPSVDAACERFQDWFGVPTKRTFERRATQFAFLRPGDVVIEVIGPKDPSSDLRASGSDLGSARISGLAFEVKGIDGLASSLKEKGYPVGEPHAALQGGRIVSVHQSGACGVPVAFIDFTGSERGQS